MTVPATFIESIPRMIQPQGFLVMFVFVWFATTGLLAFVGGWATLAAWFRASEPIEGHRFRFASGSMGRRFLPVQYRNCLFVTVADSGLHLSILFLLRFLSPLLFLPWTEVEAVTEKRTFFVPQFVITFRGQWPRVSLYGQAGEAAHKAFLASRMG